MTVAPALAAGNCVILKPPEQAPFAVLRLGELFLEAGFPPGVVNVVTAGPEGGEALVRHGGVDKIHFTGSGATARKILAAALETLKPVGLELGGKSANIVFADANLEEAAGQAIGGIVNLSGQGCINGTRVLVERPVYEQMVELASTYLSGVVVGDPTDEATLFGPVINEAACRRILGVIDQAKTSGARLVTGGERMGGDLADGSFVAPTMFADVDNSSSLAQEEIFGPVLAMMPFDTEAEAVALANDTPYGLAAYIQTNDLRRGAPCVRGLGRREHLGQRVHGHPDLGTVRRRQAERLRPTRGYRGHPRVHSHEERLGGPVGRRTAAHRAVSRTEDAEQAMKVQGSVVVVTGGGNGLGRALSERCSERRRRGRRRRRSRTARLRTRWRVRSEASPSSRTSETKTMSAERSRPRKTGSRVSTSSCRMRA